MIWVNMGQTSISGTGVPKGMYWMVFVNNLVCYLSFSAGGRHQP